MSNQYKHTYRGYLIDHHSPSFEGMTLDKLRIEDYEAFFKEAHINLLMVYCKDHWGYSYYDTKLGVKHPALKIDWVRELAEVLKRQKIEFNAY